MAGDTDWKGLGIVVGALGTVLAACIKWLDIRTDAKTEAAVAPMRAEIKALRSAMEKSQRLILLAIISPDDAKGFLKDASDALIEGFKA